MHVAPKGERNYQLDRSGLSTSKPSLQVKKKRQLNRLPTSADFSWVFADAKAVHGRFFTVLSRQRELTKARLGVVVSKKNVAKATSRNRLKRVIRESFRHYPDNHPKVDIIVLAKRGSDKNNNMVLFKDLLKIWHKLEKLH